MSVKVEKVTRRIETVTGQEPPETPLFYQSRYLTLLLFLSSASAALFWQQASEILLPLGLLLGWASLLVLANILHLWRQTVSLDLLPEAQLRQWRWRRWVEAGIFYLGLSGLTAAFLWLWSYPPSDALLLSVEQHRAVGMILLIGALVYRFIARYLSSLQERHKADQLRTLMLLGHGTAFLFLGLGLGELAVEHGPLLWRQQIFWGLLGLTGLFLMESWVRTVWHWYQPPARREFAPLGDSFLLRAVVTKQHPWTELPQMVEKLFGVKLREVWTVVFLRQLLLPTIFVTLLGAWASTCLTVVPMDSRGVLLKNGAYQSSTLEPGLHVTGPWPWYQVEIIATEQVREISLGFDRDIGGPILWNEKHFEGEKDLLVGGGEELLTINVPIYYKIKDPLAFLLQTKNLEESLLNLGYRELTTITVGRSGFDLMTVDRQTISTQIHQRLQKQIDELQLGVEIVFVGLKDIHPPVEVAHAYQDVISAEEQKEEMIYLGRRYVVEQLPLAQQQAAQLELSAKAQAHERRQTAIGESERFRLLEKAQRAQTQLFRARRYLENLETVLKQPLLVVMDKDKAMGQEFYLDLREGLESSMDFKPGGESKFGISEKSEIPVRTPLLKPPVGVEDLAPPETDPLKEKP